MYYMLLCLLDAQNEIPQLLWQYVNIIPHTQEIVTIAIAKSHKHGIDTFEKLIWTVAYLNIEQEKRNIRIRLESCVWPPDKFKSNIRSSFSAVLVSANSWGKYIAF